MAMTKAQMNTQTRHAHSAVAQYRGMATGKAL